MNLPFIAPQLATATKAPPGSDRYCHEVKYDGYRMISYVDKTNVKIYTRNGHNWSYKFPQIINDLSKLKIVSAIFDGEFVVFNKRSRPDFQMLQNAINSKNDQEIHYIIFDILFLNNKDVRDLPLIKRKELLSQVFSSHEPSNISVLDYIIGNGSKLFKKVTRLGLEGIVSKRLDAPYVSGRNKHWLKCKNYVEADFLLLGYLSSKEKVTAFLLAEKKKNKFYFCGRVSADFINIDPNELKEVLKDEIISEPWLDQVPTLRKAIWVNPKIYLSVRYTEKTQDGCLRQAIFTGIKTF